MGNLRREEIEQLGASAGLVALRHELFGFLLKTTGDRDGGLRGASADDEVDVRGLEGSREVLLDGFRVGVQLVCPGRRVWRVQAVGGIIQFRLASDLRGRRAQRCTLCRPLQSGGEGEFPIGNIDPLPGESSVHIPVREFIWKSTGRSAMNVPIGNVS
ncbi:MAG: hypothetical protein IT184_12555 [Acidobacteria bacterium]|nr:hypothetical protein [Acidobacteriota bacterium]